MSLRDFITKQFIDVIEWLSRRRHLAYRYQCRIARSRTAAS